ncbi:diaminopimelate epimerase [Methylophilus medardicus]|uniref:Diaminopimelate epimerase n=1 Tax=Methylophilus medardicus TaxID=2588534 RepID=A0A5B8CPX7_9PROT|nr:diaminopimelate epimerase [Methylophilus medardicus]QDC43304.1 diaminopimelate epimerase [Methylophilus medardicus]QDC48311.1 diaminopimelate epimerase [Methylophilus medardicus]QDC52016.1 diaminopimelate epimerase [Methylophilus medardicus]
MKLRFTKMQGAGNDFVVIDATQTPVTLSHSQIQHIANRYLGVGCDQLLMVEATDTPGVDFRYRIFNADGGEVEQCGNGARCFVRFVVEKGLTNKHEIRVETASGLITLMLQADGQVTVNMGAPRFIPAQIPFEAAAQATTYTLPLAGETVTISAVSMGNPHAVMLVDNVHTAEVATLGPQIESHPRFPQRVNAGFMQVLNEHEINLRVYERGSGETLACGTGACAAAVSGIQLGTLQSPVKVHTRGGILTIQWAGADAPVMMTGPAEIVFDGEIDI